MKQKKHRHCGEGRNLSLCNLLLLLWIAAFAAMTPNAVKASDTPDFSSFGAWPVLHDGRIKTMESFSRSVFYHISGTTHLHGISALEWMANTVFDPSSSIHTPFIKIDKKSVLDLDFTKKYHSLTTVMNALTTYKDVILKLERRDPNTLSASQTQLVQTYQSVVAYNQILQSFSTILPLNGDTKNYIEGGGTKDQRNLIAEGGQSNDLLKFIPHDNPSMPLVSLWQAIHNGVETSLIKDLEKMTFAWNEGDYKTWNLLADSIHNTLNDDHSLSQYRLMVEQFYITINPTLWIIALYVLGAVLILWRPSFIGMLYAGLGLHLAALITRSFILSRPPTGTLYETLLCGAFIVMSVGLIAYLKNKDHRLFVALCAAIAAGLLFTAQGFVQGDSLNVLVAILNTNFWLSTHVTCVIIGYGLCLVAALTGHITLYNSDHISGRLMLPTTLLALLFMAVGTLLGGIWADQSWGRFWGWDPKENGALLIVLWLIWILHGRLSGHLKGASFSAALSLTTIMVAITWFGVNLLGVGLHSYGFTSGIAWGLVAFCILQIAFVVALYKLGQMKQT